MSPEIMIVEDDQDIRENLSEILAMENFDAIPACHGADALEQLRERLRKGRPQPRAILLDLNMPVMSGREFLIALRTEPRALSTIPVIVMTAMPDASDVGTAAFLRKPIDLARLLVLLQQFGRSAPEERPALGL